MFHTGDMDLSRPLATLLSAADAGALTVLARTEGALPGRRVAELAGANHTSTLRALNGLVSEGVVLVEPAGRANLYRLNRSHVLAPLILAGVDATAAVQRRLTAQINDWVIPCLHAALYGSLARGEAGPQSDIDVLVVRPEGLSAADEEIWDTQLAQTEAMMHALTGNDLSWLDTTATDLRRAEAADEPIFRSWRDDAILLTGLPLSQLLRGTGTTHEGR